MVENNNFTWLEKGLFVAVTFVEDAFKTYAISYKILVFQTL
jgi:hypothetical protein